MNTPESAREYLKGALPPGDMARASRLLGRNHAYFQQYIKTGNPRWLPETVRECLVALYDLDGDRLRPPPENLRLPADLPRGNGVNKRQIHPQGYGKFVDDPGTLQMLDLWDEIVSVRDQDLIKRVMQAVVNSRSMVG